jgi:hypothetical protein
VTQPHTYLTDEVAGNLNDGIISRREAMRRLGPSRTDRVRGGDTTGRRRQPGYGGQDARISATLPAAQAALKAARLKHELLTFSEAGYAFFNGTGARFDPRASAEAWRRVLDWFDTAQSRQGKNP